MSSFKILNALQEGPLNIKQIREQCVHAFPSPERFYETMRTLEREEVIVRSSLSEKFKVCPERASKFTAQPQQCFKPVVHEPVPKRRPTPPVQGVPGHEPNCVCIRCKAFRRS